jgi:hypothetical protein
MDKTMVSFTPYRLKRFKKAYSECKAGTFMFEGNEYLKEYAKYVIQYLDIMFEKAKRQNVPL